ncbi:hypothetical protein Tco_0033683 [Tanacetum coccineum]
MVIASVLFGEESESKSGVFVGGSASEVMRWGSRVGRVEDGVVGQFRELTPPQYNPRLYSGFEWGLPPVTPLAPALTLQRSPLFRTIIRCDEGRKGVVIWVLQYSSLLDLEKEHTKLVYLRNEEDKRRRVVYVMNKILEFYKECLKLRPEYLTGLEDEGEVT